MITGTQLNDFDRLAVIQRSNSSTRKPLSKSYDRSCYALYAQNPWKLDIKSDTDSADTEISDTEVPDTYVSDTDS